MADLSEADRRRIQKYELIQKFQGLKKSYVLAAVLCIFLGAWGVHRFYLGHKKIGFLIFGAYLCVIIGMIALPDNRETFILPIAMGHICFVLLEIFRIPAITERENEKIKKSLEAEFYV